MKKYLFSFLITTSLVSVGQEFENLDDAAYTISYPATWELNQSGQMGMTFGLFSPIKFDGDTFRENINLIIQDIASHNLDLAGFVNLSENQIRTMIQDGEILVSEKVGEYHKVVYTGTMGQFKLKFWQQYWVKDGNAYILTFTAEQTEYDSYQEVARQMIDSFKVK